MPPFLSHCFILYVMIGGGIAFEFPPHVETNLASVPWLPLIQPIRDIALPTAQSALLAFYPTNTLACLMWVLNKTLKKKEHAFEVGVHVKTFEYNHGELEHSHWVESLFIISM